MSSPDVSEIVACLVGTCDGDVTALIEERGLQLEKERILAEVDQECFQCTACSWWCTIDEESSEDVGHDEWICRDCAEDME